MFSLVGANFDLLDYHRIIPIPFWQKYYKKKTYRNGCTQKMHLPIFD
jgi:hypothetical protein